MRGVFRALRGWLGPLAVATRIASAHVYGSTSGGRSAEWGGGEIVAAGSEDVLLAADVYQTTLLCCGVLLLSLRQDSRRPRSHRTLVPDQYQNVVADHGRLPPSAGSRSIYDVDAAAPSDADPPKADSSLFALADGSPSRTIYTSVSTASAAYPKANETPVGMSAGGGNDQDDYAAALYAGPRTTGMGRQSSNESAGVANGPMGPVSPQEPQRKRLRRGGPAGGEEASRPFVSGFRAADAF